MRIKIDDLNRIYSSNKRAFSNLNVNIEPGKSYLSVSNDIENIIFMCTRFPFQRCSFEKILFDNETIAKGDKAIQFFEESPLGGTQKTDGEPGFQQTTEKREDAIFST